VDPGAPVFVTVTDPDKFAEESGNVGGLTFNPAIGLQSMKKFIVSPATRF
jgi:hypothetical protein